MPELSTLQRRPSGPLRVLGWLVLFLLVLALAAAAAWGVVTFLVQPVVVITATLEGDEPVNAALEWNGGAHGRWVRLTGDTLCEPLPVYPIKNVTLRMQTDGDASIGKRVRSAQVDLAYAIDQHVVYTKAYPPRGKADVVDGRMVLIDTVPPLPVELQWKFWRHYAISLAVMGVCPLLIILLWPVLCDARAGFVLALAAVIGIRIWMCAWSPVMLSPDSMLYALNAEQILHGQQLVGDDWYRVPGYSAFLTPFVAWTQDFATPVGIAQAVIGVITSIFVFVLLRLYVRGPLPALAMIAVGCDPVLLTYERYLLTECLATGLVTIITVCAILLVRRKSVGGWTWFAVVLLGLACGAAIYVRSNLQILAVLIAVIVTFGLMRRGRVLAAIGHGLVLAVVCIATVIPWCYRQLAMYGEFDIAVGTNFTRSMSSWNLGLLDLDQTTLMPADTWHALEPDIAASKLTDYQGVGALVNANPRKTLADDAHGVAPPSRPVHIENICAAAVRESIARRPFEYLRGISIAGLNLLGMAPFAQHPTARENVLLSMPLRGEFDWRQTNVTQADHIRSDPDMQPLIKRVEADTSRLADGSSNLVAFNVLFWVYRQARPFVGALCLLGMLWALWRRCWGMFAAGLVVVGNAAGLALVVFSSLDRYGAPLKPLVAALAVYAVYGLARALLPRESDESTSARKDRPATEARPMPEKDILSRLEPRIPPPPPRDPAT